MTKILFCCAVYCAFIAFIYYTIWVFGDNRNKLRMLLQAFFWWGYVIKWIIFGPIILTRKSITWVHNYFSTEFTDELHELVGINLPYKFRKIRRWFKSIRQSYKLRQVKPKEQPRFNPQNYEAEQWRKDEI